MALISDSMGSGRSTQTQEVNADTFPASDPDMNLRRSMTFFSVELYLLVEKTVVVGFQRFVVQ